MKSTRGLSALLQQKRRVVLPVLIALGVSLLGLAPRHANAQTKKITVQGVVRRAGSTGTDALINSTGQAITLTLRCAPAGSCGGTERNYIFGAGLDSADSAITVRNGAFSVSLTPSSATIAEMALYKSATWLVLIDGQLDPLAPSTEFAITLEAVPFAHIADLAVTAQNAEKLQGITVDIPLGAGTPDGKILKFQGGKLTVQNDNNSGGGGGGTYTAGTGIDIDGSDVISVSSAVPLMSGGKISASNLNLGTSANQIPQLDSSGKLLSSILPSDVATLSAGKIPASLLDATSIPANAINSTHISDGSVGGADLALGGISAAHLSTGLATDVGFIHGVTSSVQGQLNSLASAVASSGLAYTPVNRAGDSMSGALNVGANVNAIGFATLGDTGTYSIGTTVMLSMNGSNHTTYMLGTTSPNNTAGQNLMLGNEAGASNTSGQQNVFVGSVAGNANTTGASNVFGGVAAGMYNTTGLGNTALGYGSAPALTTGSGNITIGIFAGQNISTASNNIAIGTNSGASTSAEKTVALGGSARANASSSVQLGAGTNSTPDSLQFRDYNFLDKDGNATFASVNGISNTKIGYLTGVTADIQTQIANAGGSAAADKVSKSGDSMSGALNVGDIVSGTSLAASAVNGTVSIGGNAVLSLGTGSTTNLLAGVKAGFLMTSGLSNTFVGSYSGYSTTSGTENSFFGQQAGYQNTTGVYNTFLGDHAGYGNTTGYANTASGYRAGVSLTGGDSNSFYGSYAGQGTSTGTFNSFFGNSAGSAHSTGTGNTAIGANAGLHVSTQSYNTFVGNGADDSGGAATKSSALGYNAIVTASSAVQLGAGANSTPDSLQFRDHNFLDKDGNASFKSVVATSGNIAVSTGQIYSGSHTVTGATADFDTGNVQVLTAVGGSTITLDHLKDGGAYTVFVTDTTPRVYSFSGCTNNAQPALSTGTTGVTIFTIFYLASTSTCYISWITGY